MPKYTEINIAGMPAKLPIITLDNSQEMATFSLHGQQALTEHCAKELLPHIKGCDVILTYEGTGTELAHCLARLLKQQRYAVAKPVKQMYILEGIAISIKGKLGKLQNLRLDYQDAQLIKGKKVAIVDTVVKSGGHLIGMETLAQRAGGKVVARAFVLKSENCGLDRDDLTTLANLPNVD